MVICTVLKVFRMIANCLQEEVFQIVLKIDEVQVVILCRARHVEEVSKLKRKQGRYSLQWF